jgi:parallel beta-helix repeat protein
MLLLAASGLARIINVPADYSTIQAGIDASVNGDTVLVEPGEYTEVDTIQDKNILLTSAEGPDATHINGHVYILGASIDSTCILRGFRISMVVESPWLNLNSLIYSHEGKPIIWGNIAENNINAQWGAGIYLEDSGAIIRGNIIRDNWSYAYWGGGISNANWDTSTHEYVIIEGNIVSGNKTGLLPDQGDAAGIDMGTAGIIRYNLIDDNTALRIIYYAQGGGIRAGGTHTLIYNNTIVGNSANGDGGNGRGGGLFFYALSSNSEGFIKNNIIAYNLRGSGAYGAINDSACTAWDYNLDFGNGGGDYIGFEPGPHDIQADPQFVDRFSGDYHLLENSPCIDAGDPSMPLDPDSTRSDIGAYYFDQFVGIDDDGTPTGPHQFSLKQNYPNPFNGQTIISYYLDKDTRVSLHIYSIMGHLVMPLVNKEIQSQGEHKYIWEGSDERGKAVSTGVYFYELYADDSRESKAMILIK